MSKIQLTTPTNTAIITCNEGGGKCFARVCLSVTQNACVDLDEMLRVDRRPDMDELINFGARNGL